MSKYDHYFKEGVFYNPVGQDFDNWVSLVGMNASIFSELAFFSLLHSKEEYVKILDEFYQQWDGYLVQDLRHRLGHCTPGSTLLAFRNALADSELVSYLDELNHWKLKEGVQLLANRSSYEYRIPEDFLPQLRNAFLYIQGLPETHPHFQEYLEDCEWLFAADPGWVRCILDIEIDHDDRTLNGDSFYQDKCQRCVETIIQQSPFFNSSYCRQFEILMLDDNEYPYVKALVLGIMLSEFLKRNPTIIDYLDYLQYGMYLLAYCGFNRKGLGIDLAKALRDVCDPSDILNFDTSYRDFRLLELYINESNLALSASYLMQTVKDDNFLVQVHPGFRTCTPLTPEEFLRLKPSYS